MCINDNCQYYTSSTFSESIGLGIVLLSEKNEMCVIKYAYF